jgi:exosortase
MMTLSQTLKAYRFYFIFLSLILTGLYFSIVRDMAIQWYRDENYSHGFLVPIISLYFLYTQRSYLTKALVKPWWPGLFVVIIALMQLLLGWLGRENFTMRSSLVILLAGLTLYLFGRSIFGSTILPLSFLLFMVPLPYILYDAAAFPLKLFVTKISVQFLKMIGVVVLSEGNIIMFPEITLEVADACSGMRSIISLLAMGVAYAFIIPRSVLTRWIIVLSTIPIAIATNAFRVIITGVLAQYWGAKAAEGFFHEFAGLAVFVIAMGFLVLVGAFSGKYFDRKT